jgi:hypothetical protein
MALKLPCRGVAAAKIKSVAEALERLTPEYAEIVNQLILQRSSLGMISTRMGVSESVAARKVTTALCLIADEIRRIEAESPPSLPETNDGIEAWTGRWPMSQLPVFGDAEAYLAAAEHYAENGRYNSATVLELRAFEVAKRASRPNTATALWRCGIAFLRMARTSDLPERHRATFLDSAKSYLEDARAVSELTKDDKTKRIILCDLAKVHLAQGHISMARTMANLAKRSADASADDGEQANIAGLFDHIETEATQRFEAAIGRLLQSRNACRGDATAAVSIEIALARTSLTAGRLARADEYAHGALSLCVQHKLHSQAESVHKLLDEIDERATRADREARIRQWVEHMRKSEQGFSSNQKNGSNIVT